jgi:hypothetical protein
MKKTIRQPINRPGFDIARVDNDQPRWSAVARDYYPINVQPRWGYGRCSHEKIEQLLLAHIEFFRATLEDFRRCTSYFKSIPFEQTSSSRPHWNNVWFSTLDGAALMYFTISKAPVTYMEVGSGFSTKFVRAAISSAKLQTKVTSIDPQPRAEIDALCDEVIRSPLEDLDISTFDRLDAGDICFFDGTHRVFTNSDTTTFFIDVLPRLKTGVLVHVHDIFWPDDYTPKWNKRLYSEQYVLGAMLLSGSTRYRVVLPNYFVSKNPITIPIISDLGFPTVYPGSTIPGTSFWFEVVG